MNNDFTPNAVKTVDRFIRGRLSVQLCSSFFHRGNEIFNDKICNFESASCAWNIPDAWRRVSTREHFPRVDQTYGVYYNKEGHFLTLTFNGAPPIKMTTSTYMTSNPGMKCIHYWYNKNLEHKESGQRERVLYFAIYLEENGLRTIIPPPLRFTGRQTTYNAATWNQVVLNFNVTAHSFKFIMDVIWQNIPPDDQLNSFSLDDFGYYDASCKDVEAEMRFSCSPWARSFHCLNGRCINEMDRCNDVDDCGDNSDELPVHAHCNAGLSAILQMVIGLTSVVLILMLMTGIFRSWQKGRCRRWIKHRRNSTTMTPDEPREILDPDTRVILRDKSKRKLEPEDVVELIPSHYPVPKKQSSAPPMRDSLVQTDESFPVNVSFIETHNAPSAETPPTTDQNNHHRGKHPFVRVNSRGVQVEEEFTLAGLDENLIKKVSRARKCQSFHDDSNNELTASKTSRNSIS